MLSSERDRNRLLDTVLMSVMELAGCDAGTLYLLEDGVLHFKIMHTNSLGTHSGGDGKDPDMPPVPLRRENVCAFAVLENRTVRIENVHTSEEYDFSGPIRYDAVTGYHTQSMLVVPMTNREGETLGVIQLINVLDENGKIQAFPEDMILALESVTSQASITILDIFDALVAGDRPYKPGMPVSKALAILGAMANKEEKLDPELTRLFIESKCWEPSFQER